MAGAFYQPHLVLCDVDTLDTLPEEIFADGIAETLKYGVIGDAGLFAETASGDFKEKLEEIIETCVKMKRDIVNEDEFDTHAYLDELRQEDNKDFQSKVLACREKYQLPPTKQERLAEKNAKLLAE